MIKEYLRLLGINMVELSNLLGVSRPTLYSYINQYEQRGYISNSKFQYIFEHIFSEKVFSRNEFIEMINYYINEYSRKYLEAKKEKELNILMNSIVKKMKKDMDSKEYDEVIYAFINMILKDYKKQEVFALLAKYFLILNSSYDVKVESREEKIFISNFYELMYKQVHNRLNFNESSYNKFLIRKDEIARKNTDKENRIKEELLNEINKQIQINMDLGLDISMEEILAGIKIQKK